jgi:RHS repeat-associated protein
LGCRKLTYHQEQKRPGFLSVWKRDSPEKTGTQKFFALGEKKTQPLFDVDYYPFGLTFNSYTSGTKNNYLFNGVEQDQATGNYETMFRGYDPALGRFMQIDPLADFLPGINPYQFAFNNPISMGDPYGLAPLWLARILAQGKQLVYNLTGRSNQHAVVQVTKKGKVIGEVGARTGGKKPSGGQKPTSSVASTPRGSIDPPKVDPPSIDLPFERKKPELIAIKERPEPDPPVIKEDEDVERNTIRAGTVIPFSGRVFKANTPFYIDRDITYQYIAPLANNLKLRKDLAVIILVQTSQSAKSPAATNYPYSELLEHRGETLRRALIDLGVDPDQIEYETKFDKTQKIEINVKKR